MRSGWIGAQKKAAFATRDAKAAENRGADISAVH
jgi:hypothetical protein